MSFLKNLKRRALRKESNMALRLLEVAKQKGVLPKGKADRLIKELRDSLVKAEPELKKQEGDEKK